MALAYGLEIVTHNVRDYGDIPGLTRYQIYTDYAIITLPMARPEQYQQAALPLTPSSRAEASPAHESTATPADTDQRSTAPISEIASIAADPAGLPHGLASHRLPDDFWAEFHLEWEFRERHGMTPVSPAEFADMRDRADGVSGPDAPRSAGPTTMYERLRDTSDD